MNSNSIRTDGWSNPATQAMYEHQWQDSPELLRQYENGDQCGGCSFYAEFNADWGLCCNSESTHCLETVFEHYTCRHYVRECWGPHSFTKDKEFHCRCGGETSEYWDNLIKILEQHERRPSGS
jgi:hypothetical protein